MSYVYTCDWCGEEIDEGTREARKLIVEYPRDQRDVGGWVAHYHARCWREVRDAIDLIRDVGADLNSIPEADEPEPPRPQRKVRAAHKSHNEYELEPGLGALIRALRHRVRLSQEGLGDLLDPPLGQGSVSQLERGQRDVTPELIEQLADAFTAEQAGTREGAEAQR